MRDNPHYIFSFSLSEEGNLLSQWRAYASYGTGISIGFNHSDLETYAKNNDLSLIQCIYETEDQISFLEAILSEILTQFDKDATSIDISKGASGQEYYQYLNKFTDQLLNAFIKIKHPVFHEEREWGLVSKFYESYVSKDIQFRTGKSTLIPYVDFSIRSMREDGYLFEQLYVGPSPNLALSTSAISAYLANKTVSRMLINSGQPYREL